MLFLSLFFLGDASAQSTGERYEVEEIIQSDRPNLIQVPDLEHNEQQIELNVLVSRGRDGSPSIVSFPVLYRIDTGPDTEFRLESDALTLQDSNTGFKDISLGLKWQVGPSTSLVGRLQVPTGSAGFGDPGVEPTLVVIQEIPFSERCAMGLNAGISFNRDIATREYYSELNVGVDVSYARTQVTAALLLKTPDALNGINRLSGAVGISHALNEDNLLLLNLGRSFSATGDDYLLIFGWSHQL